MVYRWNVQIDIGLVKLLSLFERSFQVINASFRVIDSRLNTGSDLGLWVSIA